MKTFKQFILEEKLTNGIGDNKTSIDLARMHDEKINFIEKQILDGIKVEFEHNNKVDNTSKNKLNFTDEQISKFILGDVKGLSKDQINILTVAREITTDHLMESPNYYIELAKMEKSFDKEKGENTPPDNDNEDDNEDETNYEDECGDVEVEPTNDLESMFDIIKIEERIQ